MQKLKFITHLCLVQILFLGHIQAEETENQCSQGQVYDKTLNRCVLAKETVETKSEANQCQGLSGQAYKDCFKENVDKDLKEAEAAGDIKGQSDPKDDTAIAGIIAMGASLYLYRNYDALKQCGQTSMFLMVGAGVSSLLGEYLAKSSYEKKLKKITKDYKERMKDKPEGEEGVIDSINENQKVAFEFQIEQEEARKKAHKARKNTYNLAFALYTSSAVASLIDAGTFFGKGCNATASNFSKKKSYVASIKNLLLTNKEIFGSYYFLDSISTDELAEILIRKISDIVINSSYAVGEEIEVIEVIGQRINFAGPVLDTDCGDKADPEAMLDDSAVMKLPIYISCMNKKAGNLEKPMKKASKAPYYRAAIAGLLAGYSKNIANKAGDLADEAQERISLLEKLRDDFEATGGGAFGGCTEEDREDSSKIGCYCYLSSGALNPRRQKSNACKAVFARAAKLAASKYGAETGPSSSGLKGCFNKNNKFDPKCACKKTKDKKGKNNCLSISAKVKLGGLSSVKGLKSIMRDANGFTSGNISTADLNSAGHNQLAVRMNKLKKKLAKNPKYRKPVAKVNQAQLKLKKQLENRTRRALASGKISNPLARGGLSGIVAPISKENVLKNVKKELAATKPKRGSGSSINSMRAGKKNNLSDYDLGGSSQGGVTIDDSYEIMKKDFNFNDINENSDNNLFQIISVRYQRSAFGRLFNEGEKVETDAPNETDINEK